ncbi:MAG: hypothetical protein HY301_10940 [Verrucomicrobia bacterium]|nr:hypothetical protein [Verrucomicrobiota bacterium]
MNSPMVIERAKNLVALPAFQGLRDDAGRAQFLYENVLQREPSRDETKLVHEFSAAPPVTETVNPEASAWQYGEGRYDEVTQRVADFTAFTNFNNGQWQPSEKFPDPRRGYLMLNADGGHTAEGGITHAAIRRWTAPRAGRVQIHGELSHASADGDGVRSRIVSSRAGELNVWVARNNKADTSVALLEVRAGDTVDFVTDCGANTSNDTFKWPTVIAWMDGAPLGEPVVWDTQKNFMDVRKLPKPLAAWEKFAQILLLSNEFSFVD